MDQETEERIRRRAYQLWQDDASPEGRADEYWDKAERQIHAEGGTGTPEPAPTIEQSDKRRLEGDPLQDDADAGNET